MNTLKLLAFFLISCLFFSAKESKQDKYKCMPCGLACDEATYETGGKCSKCNMALVKESTITFKNMEAAAICEYIKTHPKTILLDVRTKEEFEGKAYPDFGALKNAINIPIQELENKLDNIKSYKNQEIIVYCSHSHRSPQAAYLLTQNGFANVINMAGGMSILGESACKK